MSTLDTSPAALLAQADSLAHLSWSGDCREVAALLRAVAAEKEAALRRSEPELVISMTPGPLPAWSLAPVQGVRS